MQYLIIGGVSCVVLIALGVVLLWVFDNVFSGVLKDYFLSFVEYNADMGMVVTSSNTRLIGLAITAVFIFSVLISGTGAVCAYNAHKKQRKLLVLAQDDALRAQSLAEREMQRKSDLITYLAHDLKTPLASVIAYLSLLDESPELSLEQRAKYTGIALDKAYRLEQLIGELFEIIRFNLQTLTLNMETINLRRMLEQLADEFYPILLPQGKSIAVTCDDELTLRGDADKLARVFNNILRNAAAYSFDDSEISVAARRDGNNVTIQFINSGDPIPEEKRKLIFEKFYRLDTSRSSQTGGAGLGLAIAKEIVDAHGGDISVTSDARHTVFTVNIPSDDVHSGG